jgi:hypothetical protein
MSHQQHDSQALERYRNRAAKVAELREAVGSQLEGIKERGADASSFTSVARQMEELTLRTKELEELSQTLTPKELFLVKYGVLVLGKHTVSFVIPQGTSRIEILEEAEELAATRPLINPKWSLNEGYTVNVSSLERFCICGNVEQLKNKGRIAQEKILEENGLEMPATKDLAVAFAVFQVATGKMLSGFPSSSSASGLLPPVLINGSFWVRARGGAVWFSSDGLWEYDREIDDDHVKDVTGAARITEDTQPESIEAGSPEKRSSLLQRIARLIRR